jgi:serine/threonine-protein kinase RsbW
MIANCAEGCSERLVLRGRLSEIARIAPWIESLASRHAISAKVQFAIDLCLEEVVSNIVQHGYQGESDRGVTVDFAVRDPQTFVFVVEDEAPRFNPLEASDLPPLNEQDGDRIGGQGIRLLRRFADTVEYEPTSAGNRLRMSFSAACSPDPSDVTSQA